MQEPAATHLGLAATPGLYSEFVDSDLENGDAVFDNLRELEEAPASWVQWIANLILVLQPFLSRT